MSEALSGMLVLLFVSAASAAAWHWRMPNYFVAAAGGALTAAIAFQIFAALHMGYFDPFWPIALVVSFFPALIVALLVGLPYRIRRRRSAHENR